MGSPVGDIPTQAPSLRVPALDSSVNNPAYGPATENTLTGIGSQLGSPAQDGTVAGVTSQLANSGAAPFVPNLKSVSSRQKGPGVYNLLTFPSIGGVLTFYRLWNAVISLAAGSNNSYNAGITQMYGELRTGSGISLGIVELCIGGATAGSTPMNANPAPCVVNHNGVEVESGDTLILDVNNGVTITNLNLRASASLSYQVA